MQRIQLGDSVCGRLQIVMHHAPTMIPEHDEFAIMLSVYDVDRVGRREQVLDTAGKTLRKACIAYGTVNANLAHRDYSELRWLHVSLRLNCTVTSEAPWSGIELGRLCGTAKGSTQFCQDHCHIMPTWSQRRRIKRLSEPHA